MKFIIVSRLINPADSENTYLAYWAYIGSWKYSWSDNIEQAEGFELDHAISVYNQIKDSRDDMQLVKAIGIVCATSFYGDQVIQGE